MDNGPETSAAGRENARRLFVYNAGFLTQTRVRRILELSGYDIKIGQPGPDDMVGVWGHSPTAHRGEGVAARRETQLLRVEDAWIRSLHPGRDGEPPLGLVIDRKAAHFDPTRASELEEILASHPLDDTALLDRARGAMARMAEAHLTKFNAVDPDAPLPPPGYVLVIDQTKGDAAATACGADRNRFLEMLFVAQEENPGAPILIKSHPETTSGHREGYFTKEDTNERVSILSERVSPWPLFEGAIAVYTVSSQLGFEAIFAGHKPRVFGQPFYAGWNLTQDEFPVQRRQRRLSRAQLFAGAMLIYPKWYNPFTDALCSLEDAMEIMAATSRAWREDHTGWVASAMSLWKRDHLQRFFGQTVPVVFEDEPAKARATGRNWMVWASKAAIGHSDARHVEDGFLRSCGLGAELTPPLSLAVDDLGIYYDPTGPSRLEHYITARADLRPDQHSRAMRIIHQINKHGLSKYNLDGAQIRLPEGHKILVVGQVDDDAALRADPDNQVNTNDLLSAARKTHPHAVLVYKPHPDVEAGLRSGTIGQPKDADVIAPNADLNQLLNDVDEIWTVSSLLGFEALLRGLPVTTLGAPFYAGWGLTNDLGDTPPRRRASPSLAGLVHACLIDYPRYIDPFSGAPCPVEIAIDRLAHGATPPHSRGKRLISKLNRLLAGLRRKFR